VPSSGRIIDSIKSLVPGSIRFLENTPEAVKNSKYLSRRWVRTMPRWVFDLGLAAK